MERDRDVSVVRTEVDGYEAELRELIREYFEFADELAVERFDELSGIDAGEAAQSDVDRLASADVDGPLFLALDHDGGGESGNSPSESEVRDETDGRIVGAVQLKRLDATTAEVKRLYVVPEHRGEGLGRRLMETALDAAAAEGFATLRLGVAPYLDAAQSLYEDLGFEFTPPYEESNAPAAVRDEWQFMRYSLGDS